MPPWYHVQNFSMHLYLSHQLSCLSIACSALWAGTVCACAVQDLSKNLRYNHVSATHFLRHLTPYHPHL